MIIVLNWKIVTSAIESVMVDFKKPTIFSIVSGRRGFYIKSGGKRKKIQKGVEIRKMVTIRGDGKLKVSDIASSVPCYYNPSLGPGLVFGWEEPDIVNYLIPF